MATRTELEEMTKAQVYDLATDAEVEGRSSMDKAELIDAVADDTAEEGPTPDPTDDAATEDRPATTGIDEGLVEARDTLREREQAEADAVEARPIVGGIDDGLVAARDRTIEADATSETSATAAPSS